MCYETRNFSKVFSEIFFLNNKDSILNISCVYPNNTSHKISIKANRKWDKWNKIYYFHPNKSQIEFTSDSILYVKIKDFSTPQIFYEFIDSISLLKESKGVIFDVRHNKGGSDFGYLIYKFFTRDSIYNFIYKKRVNDSFLRSKGAYANDDIMLFMGRTKNHKYYNYYKSMYSWFDNSKTDIDTIKQKIGKDDYVYNKPVIILTDERTASAAELFIIGLKNITNPIVVGSETYGSPGQPLFFPVCRDIIAQISAISVLCNNKECFFIKPDFVIKPSIDNFINNDDIVLKKGIDLINNSATNNLLKNK